MPIKKETKKGEPKHHAEPKHAPVAAAHKAERYVEGVGRRKTSVARVRIVPGAGEFRINEKEANIYFPLSRLTAIISAPFEKLKLAEKFNVSAHVSGGGINAQAEAVRLGLARALATKIPDTQLRLHKLGFLTRDPRMVERKKYGLKKARRAPQWAKR
jgi:small subunit ribosomal protein S9